jgi:hypothetical protein
VFSYRAILRRMAEIVVTCPECKLSVKMTPQGEELLNARKTCNHRQNALNCPMLQPALATGRRAVRPAES